MAEAYRSWELRGRGWMVWDFAVDLEPPFDNIKVVIAPNLPVRDDARITRGSGQRQLHSPATLASVRDLQKAAIPQTFYRTENISEIRILPSDGLDVSPAMVSQFVLSLSSCRTPVAFELIADSEQVVAQMACDESFSHSLQSQLKAFFPGIVTVEARNHLASLPSDRLPTVVADFGLANSFLWPLMTFRSFSPDPLIGLITSMACLQKGETVVYQVLFQRTQVRWADEIQRIRSDPSAPEIFRESSQAVKEKLASPLFAVTVRLAVQSGSLDRGWSIIRTLGGNLSPFSNPSRNELIALNNDALPVGNHVLSFKSRTSYRSGMLLNAEELTGLAHIPSENVRAERLLRSSARTKEASPSAATGTLVLGANCHNGRQNVVRLSADQRLKHMHLVGATGSGKSSMLIQMMIQDAAQGLGFSTFDPHGDLIDMVMERIPNDRARDVILFDPADENFPIGFNILFANSELEKTLLASDLLSIFKRFSTSWGDVMNSVLANAILAFLESTRGGSLRDLRAFLIDRAFREDFLETVRDEEISYYWLREFPQIKGNPYAPLLTRLDTFCRSRIIRNIVGQRENKLDFRRIMDEGKILLVRLSHGAIGIENSYMLGSLIASRFYHAALSRQNIKESTRRPYFLYLDEAHNFVTESMSQILTAGRKFGLGLVTAHQQLRQFPPDLLDSILANAFTRVCFRVDEDAERLAKGFSFFTADDLKNLGVGKAVCRLEQSQYDFNLETFPPDPVPAEIAERRRRAILEHSRGNYARPRTEVESENRRDAALLPNAIKGKATPVVTEPAVPSNTAAAGSAPLTDSRVSATGRGGRHHRELQAVIKRMAETNGLRAEIEKPILDGRGQVDVSIENERIKLAAEVCVSTTSYETHNAQKCLAAGYDYVVIVVSNQKKIPLIERKLREEIPADLAHKVRAGSLMDLLAFLRQLTGSDRPSRKGKQSSGQRLNFREACELLGKAPSTLYRWLNEGRIPFYRVGREYQFDRDELLLVGKHELSGKQKVAVKLDPLRIEKAKPKTKKEQDVRYRKLLGLG